MESMDIQIIDAANLPKEDKPVWPKKKLISAIGALIGVILSLAYSLVIYKKEENV